MLHPYARLAYAWSPAARYAGKRCVAVPWSGAVLVTGKRPPCASAQQRNLTPWLRLPRGQPLHRSQRRGDQR
jgi:hypothetical protein